MPQPRNPTNILHLSGAKKRNPGRYGGRGKQPIDQRGIGRCPAFLTEAEKGAWRELVTNDPGVLQRADRIAVEMTARLMAEIRADDNITAAKQALLASMLHKLGQTPTGRNSVSIPAPGITNPFALD
jgi:hypothetical protein